MSALMMSMARDARWFAPTVLFAVPACGGATTSGLDDSHENGDAGADATPDSSHLDGSAPDSFVPDSFVPDAKPVRVPLHHRATADACPTGRGPGQNGIPGENNEPCTKDADCTQGKNGRCTFPGAIPVRQCSYDECFADADCKGGSCSCGGTDDSRIAPNVCIGGDCHIDADCGINGFCSPTAETNSCSGAPGALYCHTPTDHCIDDSDCKDFEWCAFDTSAHDWTCVPQVVCAGTPQNAGGAAH